MRVGFVVNPIAGMGGRVGLKGTDGKVAAASDRGAEPRARDRARRAVTALHETRPDVELVTWGAPMGAAVARETGFEPTVVGAPSAADAEEVIDPAGDPLTTAADTREAVTAFVDAGVDVVAFVGGDGTAADVADALDGETPMLGVPAGVKVYSSTFAVSPDAAASVIGSFDRVADREVLDVDEAAYRSGTVDPELRAVVPVPVTPEVQASKQPGGGTVESLAEGVAAELDSGVTYCFGPGSTVGAVERAAGIDGSPLGVDVWRDGETLAVDADEATILDALGDRNVAVVSPIGGQGFVLGRGNPQLSPAVVRRCDLLVVASRSKLDDIGVLRVDTGDPELDDRLRGWRRVRVGRFETRMMRVA